MGIIDVSIRRPLFILMIFVITILAGGYAYSKMGVTLFPDVEFPTIIISADFPGAANDQVEKQVTRKLEDALASLEGLKSMQSTSSDSRSTIVVEFDMEEDLTDARNRIREAVDTASPLLPSDARDSIRYATIGASSAPVLIYAVFSNRKALFGEGSQEYTTDELWEIVDKRLRNRIERISGVGQVHVIGGREKQVHIELDSIALEQTGISLSAVRKAIDGSHDVPVGVMPDGAMVYSVESLGDFESLEAISQIEIGRMPSGESIPLSRVAKIKEGYEDAYTSSSYKGYPALQIYIIKQSGENEAEVARRIKEEMAEISEDQTFGLPLGVEVRTVVDFSIYIQRSLNGVMSALIEGALLATLVVFLFLWNARSTFVTFMALPNSVIGTFLIIFLFGFTQNFMTLLALTLAVGLLIDDAIVVRENIFRHLSMGKSPRDAARVGTREMVLPVLATTATILAVFLPVSLMSGMVGQFFIQFGVTICVAVVISTWDALALAPMLSSRFVENANDAPSAWKRFENKGSKAWEKHYGRFVAFYERALDWSMSHRKSVVVIALLSLVFSGVLMQFIPAGFRPSDDRNEFSIKIFNRPGTGLQDTGRIVKSISEVLDDTPWVSFYQGSVGSSSRSEDVGAFSVVLLPTDERLEKNVPEDLLWDLGLVSWWEYLFADEIKTRDVSGFSSVMAMGLMREKLKDFPDARLIIGEISAFGTTENPELAPFAYYMYHPSPDKLRSIARSIYRRLRDSGKAVDVSTSAQISRPVIKFRYDRDFMRDAGLKSAQIGADLQTALRGTKVGIYRGGIDERDIMLRFQSSDRSSLDDLERMRISSPDGQSFLYGAIAERVMEGAPRNLLRRNRQNYEYVMSQISPGSTLSEVEELFRDEIQQLTDEGVVDTSLSVEPAGQARNSQELADNFSLVMIAAFLLIYMTLVALYESFIHPFTILSGIPLAFMGAITALWLTGSTMDIYANIGVLLLVGLVSKNGILLVDYANQLRRKGYPTVEAMRLAAPLRLRPILMTSLSLLAAMIPVSLGVSGNSGQSTMGVVVIGGLISSTILTLIFIPAFYVIMDSVQTWMGYHLFRRKFRPSWTKLGQRDSKLQNRISSDNSIPSPTQEVS